MVDATTVAVLATLVQTVVITLTLLVFIFQFRSQEKAIHESSYQNLLGRYNDFVMSSEGADDNLFARLLSGAGVNLKVEDMGTIRRLMISYGIIEEAFVLYKKGWIDKDGWEQWNTWLKGLCRHPHFATLHNLTAGMYDKEFQDHVSGLLASGQGTPK